MTGAQHCASFHGEKRIKRRQRATRAYGRDNERRRHERGGTREQAGCRRAPRARFKAETELMPPETLRPRRCKPWTRMSGGTERQIVTRQEADAA
jgi:hypothetical protein